MADQDRWNQDRERGRYGEGDRERSRGYEDYGRRYDYGAEDRERGGGYGGYGAGRYGETYAGESRAFEGRQDYETGGGYGAGYGLGDYRYGEGGYSGARTGEGAYGGGRYGERRYGESRYGEREPGEARRYGEGGYGYGAQTYSGRQYGERSEQRGGEDRTWMERAGDRLGQWFSGEGERRGEHRGRGPKGYVRSDERVREDVNDRLTDDAWLDASEVDVKVSNCEVTLTGSVDSREAKRRAEDIAEQVSGVRHVQNNLRVQEAGAQTSTAAGRTTTGATSGAAATGGTASGTTGTTTGAGGRTTSGRTT